MMTNRKDRDARRGSAVVWVLLAGVVLVVAFFIVTKKRKPITPPPVIAVATPEPATPIPATPEPVVVKATPTPMPVVVATPTPKPEPTPPSLDMATVARTPALWPAQVALLEQKAFPLSLNGRVVGEAKAPAGTVLRLLRVGVQQVEVEYQGQRQLVAVGITDLMPRALAAFRKAGSVLPEPAPTAAVVAPVVAAPTVQPRTVVSGAAKIGDRMVVEVVRQKKSRVEGGDFDDKKDRIVMKVKVTNPDPAISAENLKGEIYLLGESILDRTAVKMLAKQDFTFSLPARGAYELLTDEIVTAYDTTGARFGHRYEGWLLRIRDDAGKLLMEKSTSPTMLKNADKIVGVAVNSEFDRNTIALKPKSN